MAVTEKVSRALGLQKAPSPAINVIFDKIAGSDGRLDKEEFRTMLQRMFQMAEEQAREAVAKAKSVAGKATGAAPAQAPKPAA
jgi:hypothetical protein